MQFSRSGQVPFDESIASVECDQNKLSPGVVHEIHMSILKKPVPADGAVMQIIDLMALLPQYKLCD